MATRDLDHDVRDRSFGELAKGLSQDVSTLVRQELELAKTEMREKAQKAGPGIGMLVGAAVAALAMLGALTAFAIMALSIVLPEWLAALIVTIAWGVVVAVLAYTGRERLREAGKPVPEEAPESVKEDIDYAKARMRASREG